MKRIGLFIGFLAVMVLVLPNLTAQDEKKKDEDKTEKKEAKKDETKTPEKKDEEKKKPETKKEKLVYGAKFFTKIVNISADSSRELTIEVQEIDQAKVTEVTKWSAQRQQQLAQQYAQALQQKEAKGRAQQLQNWSRDSAMFQSELAKKSTYSPKPHDVKATEHARVRTMFPPVEFDDNGFEKKLTKKELEERKDKTGLPGYPADFNVLKPGQYVEIYMAKVAPAKKTEPKKKADDDDPPAKVRQDFVMIVVHREASAK